MSIAGTEHARRERQAYHNRSGCMVVVWAVSWALMGTGIATFVCWLALA